MIVITDGSIITLPQSLRNLYIDYVIKPRIWMPAYNFTTGRNRKLFRETWSWTRAATYRALHRFPSQRRYIIQIDPNWSAITKEQGLYIYIPAFTFFLLRRETEPIVALDSKLDPKIESTNRIVSTRYLLKITFSLEKEKFLSVPVSESETFQRFHGLSKFNLTSVKLEADRSNIDFHLRSSCSQLQVIQVIKKGILDSCLAIMILIVHAVFKM